MIRKINTTYLIAVLTFCLTRHKTVNVYHPKLIPFTIHKNKILKRIVNNYNKIEILIF
jgi:hypothetical protein